VVEDATRCYAFVSVYYQQAYEAGQFVIDNSHGSSCANELTATPCPTLVNTGGQSFGPACAAFLNAGGHAPGQECRREGQACVDGAACMGDSVGGSSCRRCVAKGGVGASCGLVGCQDDLYCDANLTCQPQVGAPCSIDWSCNNVTKYWCKSNACALRGAGDPCSPNNDCQGPDLACIGAACVSRSAAGGPCDGKSDCVDPANGCIAGACAPARDRGQMCVNSDECKGRLLCSAVCGDLPGEGDPCSGACLVPSQCWLGTRGRHPLLRVVG
jgi:hypothetical protein